MAGALGTVSDNETGSYSVSGPQLPAAGTGAGAQWKNAHLEYAETLGSIPSIGGECLLLFLIVYLFKICLKMLVKNPRSERTYLPLSFWLLSILKSKMFAWVCTPKTAAFSCSIDSAI